MCYNGAGRTRRVLDWIWNRTDILQYQRGIWQREFACFRGEEQYLQGKCVPVCLGCVIVGGLHEYLIEGGAVVDG